MVDQVLPAGAAGWDWDGLDDARRAGARRALHLDRHRDHRRRHATATRLPVRLHALQLKADLKVTAGQSQTITVLHRGARRRLAAHRGQAARAGRLQALPDRVQPDQVHRPLDGQGRATGTDHHHHHRDRHGRRRRRSRRSRARLAVGAPAGPATRIPCPRCLMARSSVRGSRAIGRLADRLHTVTDPAYSDTWVVLPTYNEADNLPGISAAILERLPGCHAARGGRFLAGWDRRAGRPDGGRRPPHPGAPPARQAGPGQGLHRWVRGRAGGWRGPRGPDGRRLVARPGVPAGACVDATRRAAPPHRCPAARTW